jgi:hypothetical protein
MDSRKRTLLVFTLILGMMACSVIPGFPVLTPTPAAPVDPTVSAPIVSPLTIDQVLNAEYTIIAFDGAAHSYRFSNGAYNQGTDPASADFVSIHIVAVQPEQQVVFGDLNQDGALDAAVLIAENYGGTGVFVSVAAVLNENGQPRHAASYTIDDRPAINTFDIRNREIFLDAVVHGPNDPGCCPELPVTRTFRLVGSQLMLVGATSKTPDGSERVITIDAPTSGAEVSGTFQLQGSITIAPFENTLGYSFISPDGSELARAPIMVTAADLGAPGTFDTLIDLSGLPPGPIWLTLADFSAADGSVLALDSVELVIR